MTVHMFLSDGVGDRQNKKNENENKNKIQKCENGKSRKLHPNTVEHVEESLMENVYLISSVVCFFSVNSA